jgi:phage terminase large subunit GpA-like protein
MAGAPENRSTITVEVAAKLIRVSLRRIHQLVEEGWIRKADGKFTVVGVVHGYLDMKEHAEAQAQQKAADNDVRRARAREIELRTAKAERELVPLEEAEAFVQFATGAVISRLQGLPARASRDLHECEKLEAIVDAIRTEVADSSQNMRRLFALALTLMKPTPRTWPDEWAARNRIYPAAAGIPGPRKPSLTPYVIHFCRAVSGGAYKRVVFVTAAQMGKTDGVIDLMGCRLDQRPAPVIYVGPSREFLTDQFEPRLMDLLDQAASLAKKVVRGRRMKKTRKIISGVPVRLAHAGSSTALKSDPAALAIVDEYDEMLANVRGQGDPLGLVEARGFTFADFCAAITSTPSRGIVDTEIDTQSDLEFWKTAEAQDLESGIWKLFQEGTRYHWAWPCPACGAYFIPRFKLLRWPEKATPSEAKRGAWLECPHCGGVIEETDRAAMNARGVYVAPGQWIDVEGVVHGEPADTSTCSFWVSGLASPFVTLGERAEAYLKALASGEDDKVQTAINAGFGECYAEGLSGDAIDWKEVAAKRVPYRTGEVPRGVLRLTAGVDVQARSLYYVLRGWGSLARSWLIDYGQLFGPTHEDAVWDELLAILTRSYDGLVARKL